MRLAQTAACAADGLYSQFDRLWRFGMEAYLSSPERAESLLRLQGDFATGMRKDASGHGVRGDFATGVRGTTAPLSRQTGDFAAGLRSHLHDALAPRDFASGLRTAEAEAAG